MKQVEVQIMGQSYLLGCPEGGEARLLDAVHRVDAAMCAIRDAGRIKARDRIAVLAALNLSFDLADRSGSPAAPSLAPVPSNTAAAAGAAPLATVASDSSDARLAALVRRLDNALANDGLL